MKDLYFERVCELADYIIESTDPKMKWMWGEALLGYALDELDKFNNENKYTEFLLKYCDYWGEKDPAVDQSDTLAPGLITYAMQKRTGNTEYKRLTNKVLDYIQNGPRIVGDCLNHLGNSGKAKLYPQSVWVDSVMMFSVFTSLYGKENNNQELIDFAARQPKQYASMLQDNNGLWYHAYWSKKKKPYPGKGIYWGRGNGWVIAGFPMILDNIGDHKEKEEIIKILNETSEALLKCMREDYTFSTLLTEPKTYRELSATALIAAGWMHGVRMGYLPNKFLEPAKKAFIACVEAIKNENEGIYFNEISGPTIPLQVFPKLGYKLVPLGKNWSYGVAAIIFAAIEYAKISE